jgi:hypothetical protein
VGVRRAGRPAKGIEKRDVVVTFRVNEAEHAALVRWAAPDSVAKKVRETALQTIFDNRPTDP